MTFEQGLLTALIAGAISIISIWLDKKFFSLQFEKKIVDFNFFIKKKHEVYPELHKKILMAESRTKALRGGASFPDYNEYDIDDIKKYLEGYDLLESKKKSILDKWIINKKEAIENLIKSLILLKYQHASKEIFELRNYFWFSVIYIDEDIEAMIKDVIEKLEKLLAIYSISADPKKDREEAGMLIPEIDKLVKDIKDNLQRKMRDS